MTGFKVLLCELVDNHGVDPHAEASVRTMLLFIPLNFTATIIQDGRQPLHFAISGNHMEVVKSLVEMYDVSPTAPTDVWCKAHTCMRTSIVGVSCRLE